ncbi:MAG: class I SAM-dependent RNA methyltransferase [Chloroflexota bacterium]
MPTKTFTVEIEKLVYGGEGMARLPDGRAVFVPFVLPGERVAIDIAEDKRRFARAALVEVLEPSPDRITPKCKHFTKCGGCHYQHITYADQLSAKTEILRDQLQRIAKIDSPDIQPMIPSPSPWNYRNNIQFHQNEAGELGFLASRSDQIIAIEECHLPQENLNALWPEIKIDPLPELLRLGLRSGMDQETILVLESAADEAFDFSVDFSTAAVQLGPNSTHILAESFYFTIEIKERAFRVSADSFFQVNTKLAEQMVDHLLANLNLTKETIVLDLYCGVGLFSAFLAPKVKQLIGIEINASAVEDFTINLDEFENVEVYNAAVEKTLPALKVSPNIIVVDPPRSGIGHKILDTIIEMDPGVLVMISCDPATLGRDAKRLIEAGYTLKQITPIDLFPQTFHIESISYWHK